MASFNAWLDNASGYSRKTLRQLEGALMGGKTSTRPLGAASGVTVGQGTSLVTATSTVVTVKAHVGILDLETSASMGPSQYVIDANWTSGVTAANSTYDRIDLIYIYTLDSTQTAATPTYLAGTAASSPVAPATPANGMALATLRVPAGGGTPAVTFVAPWAVAAGGIQPVPFGSYPTSPYVGQPVFDGGLKVYDGTRWGGGGSSVICQRLDSNPLNNITTGTHVVTYDDVVDVRGPDLTFASGLVTAQAAMHASASASVEWPVGSGVVAAYFEKNGASLSQGRHEHDLSSHRVTSVAGSDVILAAGDTLQLVLTSLDGTANNVFVRQFAVKRIA